MLVCIRFLFIFHYALLKVFLVDLFEEVADLGWRHVDGDFWGEVFAVVAGGAGW